MVLLDGRPIGLLQRSVIADNPEELAEFATLVDIPESWPRGGRWRRPA